MNRELAALLAAIAAEEENDEMLRGRQQPRSNVIPDETPAALPPVFSSAEIGTVDASTVEVTFDQDITASNYATGVTIKVNDVSAAISSATRQANHAVVRYVIPVLWHGSGDSVTWEYDADTGDIAGESGSLPLEDVSAQAVTNNVSWESLLDLQADAGVTESGGVVSAWADQSGNGNNFAQATEGARPTIQTDGDYPAIVFDGSNDFMEGGNFADNPVSFTIFLAIKTNSNLNEEVVISKINEIFLSQGWFAQGFIHVVQLSWQTVEGNEGRYLENESINISLAYHVHALQKNSHSAGSAYVDGDNSGSVQVGFGTVTTITNSDNVRLGTSNDPDTNPDGYWNGRMRAVMICQPSPSAADRAALETRLGARYGLIVP
jgi:hypothetical protein